MCGTALWCARKPNRHPSFRPQEVIRGLPRRKGNRNQLQPSGGQGWTFGEARRANTCGSCKSPLSLCLATDMCVCRENPHKTGQEQLLESKRLSASLCNLRGAQGTTRRTAASVYARRGITGTPCSWSRKAVVNTRDLRQCPQWPMGVAQIARERRWILSCPDTA